MPAPMGQPFTGLQKKAVALPFAQGIDTKNDPLQLKPGSMAALNNCVFNKAGRVDKRNGFAQLTTISGSPTGQQITNYAQGNALVAYGPNEVQIYDQQASTWVQAGTYNPMSVKTVPVIQNNSDNRTGDIAFDPVTGRYCAVTMSWNGSALYQVFDKFNVSLAAPVTLAGSYARVFKLGVYFIVTYHSSGPALSYIAIPIATPTSPNAPVSVATTTITATPASGSHAFTNVTVNTFEYGYSSNNYSAALLAGGTHGVETAYFQGDFTGNIDHSDLSISMATTVSTQNDIAACLNAVSNPPSSTQGSTAVNCFFTNTSGTATVAASAAAAFTGGSNPCHDGVVASDGNLYLVVGLSGGGVKLAKLTAGLVLTTAAAIGTDVVSLLSITDDSANSRVWITYQKSDMTVVRVTIQGYNLAQALAPTTILTWSLTSVGLVTDFPAMALCSIIQGANLTVFYQTRNWYSASQPTVIPNYFMSASQRSDHVRSVTVNSSGGIVTAAATLIRGVGLASKPIIFNSVGYFIVNYQSPLEPTNFLIDFSGNILAKMGPGKSLNTTENGFSWYLPTITSGSDPVTGNAALLAPHLVVDQLISVQKVPGNPFPTGIFTFAGLNYDILQFNLSTESAAEISDVLHLAGGFPWMYDTSNVVEHGFHVYPDVVLLTANGGSVGNSFTQYWYATYEWVDSTGKLHRSAPSFPIRAGALDNNGNFTINVPTLRLTAKKNVQICLYRWSQSQPSPFFVTSGANDPTKDFVSLVDASGSAGNDVVIQGNRLLYTWGGELENIAAPACISMSMFRARLFVVSSEDQNQIYFSKQCIEGVPAEFGSGFQMFIAPTISASGPTGVVQALYPLDDKLIIFKTNAIYYIVGNGPDNTGQFDDFSDPIFITSSVGCSNKNSAIMIPDGVIFQSAKGLWLLGRDLSTNYIGAPVEDLMAGRSVVSADSIPNANHVRFVLDNGVTLVYDYFFKQWATFTMANGAVLQDSCIYNNQHTLLDNAGNILQETPGVYVDGTSSPVAMSFKTGWYAFTGVQGFQRAYFFNLLGTFSSAHNLNITVDYDYGQSPSQVVNTITGDSKEQYRVFLTQQKCQALRLNITESLTSPGAGLSFTNLNLWIGGKFGQYPRLLASQSTS